MKKKGAIAKIIDNEPVEDFMGVKPIVFGVKRALGLPVYTVVRTPTPHGFYYSYRRIA